MNEVNKLDDKQVTKIIEYWITTSEHDYKTMESLYKCKRYSDTLFYGHLVIEKVLKAWVVKYSENHALPIHNLLYLYKNSGLTLPKESEDFLAEVNKFNIRARYPDFKLSFYKLCTKEFTIVRFQKIKELYKELCLKIKETIKK